MNNIKKFILAFIFILIAILLIVKIYWLINPLKNDLSFEYVNFDAKKEATFQPELYGINAMQLVEMLNKIENNWRPPKRFLRRQVILRFDTDNKGYLKKFEVLKSSGDKEFDNSALSAVQDSNPLPIASEMQDKYYVKLILTNQNHHMSFDEEGIKIIKDDE